MSSFLNIGEKDGAGRQKRIEHRGRYLRASRTGGVSLRAQTRAAGVNLTANTSRGVRVSTRLAKNTQVAFQNGRFVLRGRYGSDAAKVNLSKSGLTVSTKTPVGAINWFKPARSSFKMAGIQLRGEKAAVLQGVYAAVIAVTAILGFVLRTVALLGLYALAAVQWLIARWQAAAAERDRPRFTVADIALEGARILANNGVDLGREPARDLLAALTFTMVCLGRGETRFDPVATGLAAPESAAAHALATDIEAAGEPLGAWLAAVPEDRYPKAVLGLAHALAEAFAAGTGEAERSETLLALDDACLAGGPRTLLQEEMLDILAEILGVQLVLEGEG